MSFILEFLLEQYSEHSSLNISLEITAVILGLISVWFSKNNSIWVYPTGMISTSIYVYLLFYWGLIGDLLINAYYFFMSIYGWYYWTRSSNGIIINSISKMNKNEYKTSLVLFIFAIILFLLYIMFLICGIT